MAGKLGIKGTIVKEGLNKNPEMPAHQLARILYRDNKMAFSGTEEIRTMIRYYRGSLGDKGRKEISDKTHVKPVGHFKLNPYKLPESYSEERPLYIVPKSLDNILVISDLHFPYHDIGAITAALKYGQQEKVKCVLINGDLLDFSLLSRFEKDPRARSVKDEFDATRDFLVKLRKAFPKTKIIWLKGNHDKRYEKWLFAKAPEIFDDNYYLLEERLRLNELKIELLDDNVLIKVGKGLFITHGHLLIRGVFAPVNSARGVFLRAKASCLISHVHNTSEHSESNLKDEIISCWSIGCLCDLHPNYDPLNSKHNHGFAHITVDKLGNYNVKNIRIYNGKIL